MTARAKPKATSGDGGRAAPRPCAGRSHALFGKATSGDRGQAAPLMVVMLVAAMVAVVAAVEIGQLLDDAARARTAADAAALAGAAAGRSEAAALAAANGGSLRSYQELEPHGEPDVTLVTVEVQVGRASRTARAERLVEWTR